MSATRKREAVRIVILVLLAILLIFSILKRDNETLNCSPAVLKQMVFESASVFYSFNQVNPDKVFESLLGFNINSPMSIIKSNVFALSLKEPEKKEEVTEKITRDKKPIVETTINQNGTLKTSDGVAVKNATTYSFSPDELISEPLSFDFNGNGPKVLIVQSHSSESYTATDKNYYLPTDPDRTEDINYNVVRVGKEICDTLKSKNIEVLHDTSLHDYPSYNGSYKSSLASVNGYLEKYPSLRVVLDIHRDAMVKSDGTKIKLATEIDGKKAAQIMLLTGSDQGGLDHPLWRENLKFAMKFQRVINKMYPNLARPVSFTKERYNTHTTKGSIIIEVGTTGNTLEEALYSAKMIGNALSEFILENK